MEINLTKSKLSTYLQNINKVKGWCNPELWNCIEPIDIFQRENNITGPIGEIGVYHGKFFIGLALTKFEEVGHVAFDVFDLQEFNLDNAGEGSLEELKNNCELNSLKYFDTVTVDSLRITDEILDKYNNKFSLFSVDGCHMKEHTVNDLQVAMKLTKKEGIIFIDDYYNPNWPGVQEGITKYYLNNLPDFVPLLFTCNKLFLCSLSLHQNYLTNIHEFLKNNYPESRVKLVERFGYKSLTVIPNWKLGKYIIN